MNWRSMRLEGQRTFFDVAGWAAVWCDVPRAEVAMVLRYSAARQEGLGSCYMVHIYFD